MADTDISKLKKLLFEEENNKYLKLSKEIRDTSNYIDEQLASRQLPKKEVDRLLGKIVTAMPDRLGPAITKTLKVQIKESKDDVVQALFPIIGQMIKKYVQAEMELLNERIEKQFDRIFSVDFLWLKLKSTITGVPYNQLVLNNTKEPRILEIFLIEDDSGILMASYSKAGAFDQDMVAGMLTAIRAFVKDAMLADNQTLEMIAYDLYKIHIQNFHKFYLAVVLSGVVDETFKSKLHDRTLSFAKEAMRKSPNEDITQLTKCMEIFFKDL